MKALRLGRVFVVLGMTGVLFGTPSHASDQALQTILFKLRCVPAKIVRTELAAGVFSYEVTCKGRADVVFIVCRGLDCREQTKRRNHVQESEMPP